MPHTPSPFYSNSWARGEFGAEAGRHGKGWSCLQAMELMLCETTTYGAEGVTEFTPPSHPHTPARITSIQKSSHL